MKKPRFQVAPSKCRNDHRSFEDNHHVRESESRLDWDDRPERELPYHCPHGYDTEGDLRAWIEEEMKGGRP